MTKLLEEVIVGEVPLGEEEPVTPPYVPGAPPYIEVEIDEEEYAPPLVGPHGLPGPRQEVTRSMFYTQHERILKELRKAGDKGMCLTDKELATITGIDIESVLEHRHILELDEAVKTVQDVENPVVCHVDRLSRVLRKLRER